MLGLIPARAGYRWRTARLLQYKVDHVAQPNSACMFCGSGDATFFRARAKADKVPSVTADLRQLHLGRAIGQCNNCRVTQDYYRPSVDDIREWCAQVSSKDESVSEEPDSDPEFFNKTYFYPRFPAWRAVLGDLPAPRRMLFLRPYFGAAPRFFIDTFGTECEAVEISRVCEQTIRDTIPAVTFPGGNIHGAFWGPFLDRGPYDAISCFHTIIHCTDPMETLDQLRSLLKPGGFIIFTHEINVKPTNPFHLLLADELRLLMMLNKHFRAVVRINSGEQNVAPHIARFTDDGTNPDFLVMR